jgi:hypothetical protein
MPGFTGRGERPSVAQVNHHGRMVTGPFVLARQLVDAASAHTAAQRLTDEDVINTQALVLAEGQVAVVPPAPGLRGLIKQPKGVHQSADKLDDTRNGASYLRVRVALPPAERARLEGVELRAGLPVDVMVKLGERSLLAWWLKPLSDRLGRTFSEA